MFKRVFSLLLCAVLLCQGCLAFAETEPAAQPQGAPETLAARVLTVEHEILPESVRLFCAGKLGVDGRHVHVL